jgi:hypothetical protein
MLSKVPEPLGAMDLVIKSLRKQKYTIME